MPMALRGGFTPLASVLSTQLSPGDACMQTYYFIGVSRRDRQGYLLDVPSCSPTRGVVH